MERFTRVGPNTLNYEVTVTDPTVWTKPWTAMIPLKQTDDLIYEYACHEGNYRSMEGSLKGLAPWRKKRLRRDDQDHRFKTVTNRAGAVARYRPALQGRRITRGHRLFLPVVLTNSPLRDRFSPRRIRRRASADRLYNE